MLLAFKDPLWISFFYYIGLLHIVMNFVSVLKWVFIAFLKPAKDLKKSYGSWALVTGSTDGIGKAFAFQLASKGLNLVLVSRSSLKLDLVSTEIKQRFPHIEIITMAIDLSEGMSYITKEIERVVEGLDVGVLVNNVGISYPKPMYFHEVSEEVWMKVIRVNVEGTMGVTKAVLPGMLKRRKGAIVNIGSGASVVVPSHPLYAIYGATKSYIDRFSRSLHVEYKHLGIDVQCQVPLYVATSMVSKVALVKGSSLFVPTAEDYVAAAVRRIGFEARCCPYWAHYLQWCATSFVPKGYLDAWRLSVGIQRRANSWSFL
ncbi:very-long-chain 3-oxoacyl-CoA reductase-like protein At1g24470 [Silene latifolia]|uniref:very-long-chain 3-oxoacyl-CoA reductase-like protein At1g24470 n=1 Tax=Silene latifolia TaxID=37657 RepID=UPI003D783280